MLRAHRRGFDWKEIAAGLHMTRALAPATFWREIKRPRSEKADAPRPATVTQRDRDPRAS